MPDTFKLRMKVGVHEFDAEGPKDEVTARFEAWKALIEANTAAPLSANRSPSSQSDVFNRSMFPASSSQSASPSPSPSPEFVPDEMVQRVFAMDERRNILTLRIHPAGETKEADAVLLLLYGYAEWESLDEVPVTKLTQSLQVSGLRTGRVDRAAAPHIRSNYLFKHGSGKGGRYAMTTTGKNRAEALTKELFDRVA